MVDETRREELRKYQQKRASSRRALGLPVNLHSKLTRDDHLKLTHLGGCKAHRRAAPKWQARLWALLAERQVFWRDLLWAKP
jgi:hypothetical protein